MFKNGEFNFQDGVYEILKPDNTRVLENILFNNSYFTVCAQTGTEFSRYSNFNGKFVSIIGENEIEPSFIDNNRLIYLKDEETGKAWNIGYYPLMHKYMQYKTVFGPGIVKVINESEQVYAEWEIIVPKSDFPIELWRVTLKNNLKKYRKISMFSSVYLTIKPNVQLYGYASFLNSFPLQEYNGIGVKCYPNNAPHKKFSSVFLSSDRIFSFEGNKIFALEQFRTLANPLFLDNNKCSNFISSRDPVLGVLHHKISLKPGQRKKIFFLIGAVDVDKIKTTAKIYFTKYLKNPNLVFNDEVEHIKNNVRNKNFLLKVDTENKKFDILFNLWIPQLIEFGVKHVRWGGIGYRDIVQQVMGYLYYHDFKYIKKRIKQFFSYQFYNGNALRSYPAWAVDSGIKYSDSSMWTIITITEYIKETGDFDILNQEVPYIDKKGETIWKHLLRVMKFYRNNKGKHGLSLMHGGDWNDSLTAVGIYGKGESVWLSEAYAYILLLMEEISIIIGKKKFAKIFHKEYELMKKNINKYCWDGNWYIRAFDDNYNKIGSKKNKEGKIFLNSQSWAYISNIASPDRIEKSLNSINKYLITPYGASLLYPTYTKEQKNIGRLSLLEPGCSENGSVYTHATAFLVLGLIKAGKRDEAFEFFERILPYNPDNPSESVIPYQLSNSYGGVMHRYEPGRAQYGWVTGSGSWLIFILIEYFFGVRRTYTGIKIEPNLPLKFNGKKIFIRRIYRNNIYNINFVVTNKKNIITNKFVIYVNKKIYTKNILPLSETKKEWNVNIIF